MKKIKLFPALMTVLSALYLVNVAVSEDFKYDVDTVGGDPGGKLLPLIMASFLFVGFLYITIKERPDGKKMDSETKFLFITTLVLSVFYIVLHKIVGFVVLTVILLYVLLYLYTTIGEKRSIKRSSIGFIFTLLGTVGVYTVSRKITKIVLRAGRGGLLPAFFGKSSGAAIVALVFVTAIVVLLSLTLVKSLKKKGFEREANAGIITFATVLFLYIVFKQFFLVTLAPGILNF